MGAHPNDIRPGDGAKSQEAVIGQTKYESPAHHDEEVVVNNHACCGLIGF